MDEGTHRVKVGKVGFKAKEKDVVARGGKDHIRQLCIREEWRLGKVEGDSLAREGERGTYPQEQTNRYS